MCRATSRRLVATPVATPAAVRQLPTTAAIAPTRRRRITTERPATTIRPPAGITPRRAATTRRRTEAIPPRRALTPPLLRIQPRGTAVLRRAVTPHPLPALPGADLAADHAAVAVDLAADRVAVVVDLPTAAVVVDLRTVEAVAALTVAAVITNPSIF